MEKIICIILLVLYGVVMLMMCCIALFKKKGAPKNKVHFYVARDKDGELFLYLGKPRRDTEYFISLFRPSDFICRSNRFDSFGLKEKDYANLKWEDDPVEVFINMKD